MRSTEPAVFLERQLVRSGSLVLGRRIIPAFALATGQCYNDSHALSPSYQVSGISSLVLEFVFFLAENKSEYRISKSETNSKLEFPNVQNSGSMWNTIFLFWSFELYGDSVIVSNFDIRISYFPACPG